MSAKDAVILPPRRSGITPARIATGALFFGNGFGIGVWAAQIPRFKSALALSDGALSLALLAFALGAILSMPATGWLAARAGSRRAAIAAAFAFATALVPPGVAPGLVWLAAAALLAGACNGAMDVAMNTHATAVERVWGRPIMSSFHAFFSLGGLGGAAMSGALIAAGLEILPTLLVCSAGMALVFLASTAALRIEGGESATGGHGLAWPRGAVVGIGMLTLLCMAMEGAMTDWTAVYLRDVAGASLETAVSGFAAFSLAMTAGRLAGDAVVRRLGCVRTLTIGGLLAAAGLALATAAPWPPTAAAGFALLGLGLANVVPVLFSAAGQTQGVAPSAGVAMVATLGYAGFLLGPPLIGFGGDLVGLRVTLALLVAGGLAIAALSSPLLQSRDR